jgi:hypothetical protein
VTGLPRLSSPNLVVNEGDERGSEQKGLVLVRVSTWRPSARLATAVGAESLRDDRSAFRLGINRLSRGFLRRRDDYCDEKDSCKHRFHSNLPDLHLWKAK